MYDPVSVVYTFDSMGGFVAGDPKTGRAAYACPTSDYAKQARRGERHAHETAVEMVSVENECADVHDYLETVNPRDDYRWSILGKKEHDRIQNRIDLALAVN